jgi:hypothetical protein
VAMVQQRCIYAIYQERDLDVFGYMFSAHVIVGRPQPFRFLTKFAVNFEPNEVRPPRVKEAYYRPRV